MVQRRGGYISSALVSICPRTAGLIASITPGTLLEAIGTGMMMVSRGLEMATREGGQGAMADSRVPPPPPTP